MSFLTLATKFVKERGISIVPTIPGDKPPGEYRGEQWFPMKGWSELKNRLPTANELHTWSQWPEPGIAVMLGKLSGIVAIDFDHKPELHAAIASILPATPLIKQGVKGKTYFYQYANETGKSWSIDGKVVIEILSEHPCVIPPSVHPTGVQYEWIGEALENVEKSTLPRLPENIVELINDLFNVLDPKRRQPKLPKPTYTAPLCSDIDRVLDALQEISPDEYETWVRVGMAIKSQHPGNDGFSVWDNWSQRSTKYEKNRPGEMQRKWNGFKTEGVQIGTLYHIAKENGYSPKREGIPKADLSDFLAKHADKPKPKNQQPPMNALSLPVDLLTSAPGVVGEIAAWVSKNSFYEQHAYALAAALSFVGMLKGHQVCTEEDARTNLLTIAVGPSSSGKSNPLKSIAMLAAAVGVEGKMIGKPASEAGLIKAMHDVGGKCLLQWDEIGLAFKSMFAFNAQQYKVAIIASMLELYSKADSIFYGQQYANHDGKTPRIDLVQPCLCLYGTTTAEGIYQAFSSTEAINGFAARLLIFETHDYVAKRQSGRKTAPPEDLVHKLRRLSGEDRIGDGGNLAGIQIIDPVTVPYSRQARPLVEAALDRFEQLKNDAILGNRKAEEAIWGRAYEHMIKLALTVEDSNQITPDSVKWAMTLVEHLCKNMIIAAGERIADNQVHAELNTVLKVIKDTSPDWISTNDLYRRTRTLARFKRQEHLNQLIDEGTIEVAEEDTSGRKRKLYRFVG